ncbi:peptidase S8 [Corallococcus sp. H22C18031201]|uniref:subtilisin-like protease PopC n=1 Tax=Citreicoccus inhibens TaxID=2849499 RepID=UPI000E7735AE|nr:S8 family serine peptidase [Citreicoccus inhibens]MBU8900029.1 S8 family serine peptidase [Citreicoccus inhibens]RJS20009.1 peptidase S8 [Corallococcus sp. H22C18031201]
MKSFLLVPKESIESQARPGVRGTEQGERVLLRNTALRFSVSQKAPDALASLGLRSATLPGPRPQVSGRKLSKKAGASKRLTRGADATTVPLPGSPVTEQTGAEEGSFRYMPLIGATMAHFYSPKAEEAARGELAQDFEFIPDVVPLSFPGPVSAGQTGPRNRGMSSLAEREWPEECGVPLAHAQGIRGAGVMLGILDTGVDADHPEHASKVIQFRYVSLFPNSPHNPARDVRGFDPDGHGTHVCGIAAGVHHGVAPEVDLYVASVIESETIRTSLGRVAAGMEWLLHQFSRPENATRPAVVNLSLGFPLQPPPGISDADYQLNLRALQTMIRRLQDSNVLAVVAAGNSGPDTVGYPAAFPEALAIGAVDFERNVATFSASGVVGRRSVPDVMGYGVNVYSSTERRCNNQAFYERMSGTSMAAPYVAGIAALYRCRAPDLTALEVRDLILANALKLPRSGNHRTGRGLAVFR